MSKLKLINVDLENLFYTYLHDISKFPILSQEEEISLVYKAQNGDQNAYNRLITCNLKFVVQTAKKYVNQGIDLIDLVSVGNIGLMEAINKFDPKTGNKLITYAVWWIRQKILESISNESRTIRIPLNRNTDILNILKGLKKIPIHESYLQKFKKLYEDYNYSEFEMINSINAFYISNNLYTQFVKYDVNDLIAESEIDPLIQDSIRNILISKINKLDERESYIMNEYFNISGKEFGRSLEDIGEELNLTRERVRQIKDKSLKKLQNIVQLEDFSKTSELPYCLENLMTSVFKEQNDFIYNLSDKINHEVEHVVKLKEEEVDDQLSLEEELMNQLFNEL